MPVHKSCCGAGARFAACAVGVPLLCSSPCLVLFEPHLQQSGEDIKRGTLDVLVSLIMAGYELCVVENLG